jgi:hypothetical protein
MIMTIGEYIRKNDQNLAVMVVILMRMKNIKEINNLKENIEINEDDILWMLSYLKRPIDTDNPFPWGH